MIVEDLDCVVYKILNPTGSSAKSTKIVNIISKLILQRGEEMAGKRSNPNLESL